MIYMGGSSVTHPEAGMVGGYGVFFGDHRDTARYIPTEDKQTNHSGELLAALHAIRHRTPQQRTLICSDSKLVIMGAIGKASKWKRHDGEGSRGPVGHTDLWEQILQEIASAGPHVKWMYVRSHVGIPGNTKADTLADMGRRRSPLLKGYVTASHQTQNGEEPEPESDFDEPPLWSLEERGGGPDRRDRRPAIGCTPTTPPRGQIQLPC